GGDKLQTDSSVAEQSSRVAYHPFYPDWRTASLYTCDFDSDCGVRPTCNCCAVG
ncbi:hypothetical protein NQZ68_025212, partial [Dissostichus eleginoides]